MAEIVNRNFNESMSFSLGIQVFKSNTIGQYSIRVIGTSFVVNCEHDLYDELTGYESARHYKFELMKGT